MNDAEENPHQGTTYIRLRCYNPYIPLLLLLSVEVKLDTEQDRDYLRIYVLNKIHISWKTLREAARIF